MSDHTASVDAGNGGTNAVLASGKGYTSVYFPSIRAAVTGDNLGIDGEMQVEYIDWSGHRYIVGDDVLNIARRRMEKHQGHRRYGDEFHMFLTAAALARLGVKSGTVALTLFAPPGMFRDVKTEMQTRFLEGSGSVTIRLKSDRKARAWQYESVRILPEAAAAAACFTLDDTGNYAAGDTLNGDVLLLDLGAYTADALLLSNGVFNPETVSTFETGGIDLHIRQPVLQAIKKHGEDFTHLTADDIDRVIRGGYDSGNWTLHTAGFEVDLEPTIRKHVETYAGWIANHIIDSSFDGLRGVRSLILVGGGAILAREYLTRWYEPKKIVDTGKHPLTRKIHPTEYNAVGGLRLALAQQKQKA